MRQSELFYKTLKKAPKNQDALSSILLTRAGFIDQAAAGSYTFLPLGFRVLKKIENIIREEMIKVGGQEILMPALTPKENWQKTGRWQSFAVLFKIKTENKKEYALGPTHEEVVAPLAKKIILSYKDLPVYLFQIQAKFRNELRAKSGLIRTREFLMKDLYSFHRDENDLDKYYQTMADSYFKIFKRCSISVFKTLASGGSFSKYSHEYQTLTEAGEDIIYICQKCRLAINREVKNDFEKCPECSCSKFESKKGVEVGNIFKLGDKYSLPFELKFKDKDGREKSVIMGCYGIGLPRLMAAVVEHNHDSKGIIWPKEVAPFKFHLIQLENNKKVKKAAEQLYKNLDDVLYDDRADVTVGEKFAESDLIGIPTRIVISEKTLKSNSAEIKKRSSAKTELKELSSFKRSLAP